MLKFAQSHSRAFGFRSAKTRFRVLSAATRRWWRWTESNCRPPACKAGALPAELHPQSFLRRFFSAVLLKPFLSKDLQNWTIPIRMHVTFWPLRYADLTQLFSIERRWSSRTFRYGYLVTTSPQSPILPSAASSRGWTTDFGYYRLPWCDGRCVQGPGTYSPRHADPRLLAIPTSCRRVAACNLNWDVVYEFCSTSRSRFSLFNAIVVRV